MRLAAFLHRTGEHGHGISVNSTPLKLDTDDIMKRGILNVA